MLKLFAPLKARWARFCAGLEDLFDRNDVFLGPGLWTDLGPRLDPGWSVVPCTHLEERETLCAKVRDLESELQDLKVEVRAVLWLIQALGRPGASREDLDATASLLPAKLAQLQALLTLPDDAPTPG